MKIYSMYECELCGHASRDRAEVESCEAAGAPPVPDWALARVGQSVRGFGEGGVRRATLRALELRRAWYGTHVWFAVGDFWLSHNQSGDGLDGVPVSALDPMHGWDFLRACDDDRVDAAIREWAACCAEYGVEPDPRKAPWFDTRGKRFQQCVLAALARWRAGAP